VKTTNNPYATCFPRGQFIKRIPPSQAIHPLCRQEYASYFQDCNPKGYHHDLGAQDVFLDNAGMLYMEQSQQTETLWKQYFDYIHVLMRCWEHLEKQIVQKRPYWGRFFNSPLRDANAGEPRGLLRFMGDTNWAQYAATLSRRWTDADLPSMAPLDDTLPEHLDELLDVLLRTHARVRSRFVDWSGEALLPPEYATWNVSQELREYRPPSFGGVELPRVFSPTIDRIRILHPLHSTPDLPLRVGGEVPDFTTYRKRLRNQGSFMTCCSHAVSVGLDLLIQRQFGGISTLSPAWLHCRTGTTVDSGRNLSHMVDALRERLPCAEDALPYEPTLRLYRQAGHIPSHWETPAIQKSSGTLTQRYGLPQIRHLAPDDISAMKTYLAAGWIVIVSTFLTDEFYRHRALNELGLPLTPLYGQHRRSDFGHVWLLVGYDHVDGNQQWKYQGRFYALNSWGEGWPCAPVHGPGLCSLPFAMLLTEGIEAFAIRFVGR
jgi:hypothetical protein